MKHLIKSETKISRQRDNKIKSAICICLILLLLIGCFSVFCTLKTTQAIRVEAAELEFGEGTGSQAETKADRNMEPEPVNESNDISQNQSGTSTQTNQTTAPNQIVVPEPTTPTPAPEHGSPYLLVGEDAIIKGDVGTKVRLNLPLINLGNIAATDIVASPILSNHDEDFPFEIEKSEYLMSLSGKLQPVTEPDQIKQATKTVNFGDFQIRKNLNSGYYRVTFKINYRSALNNEYQQIERYIFIKVNNPNKQNDGNTPPLDPGNTFDPGALDVGGYSGGFSDSGDTKNTTPRLLINGFSTNPEKLFGGEEFDLTLKLKNTSKESAIKNVKITMQPQGEETVFLPTDGASTLYIESVSKDTEQSISLKLKSNPTVQQKIYPLNLKFEYEDAKGNAFNSEEMISLMVNQKLRCDIGKIEIMPNPLNVGSEANIMFSVFNKGKATLYNLSIIIPENGPLEENEIFVGNVDSGTSKDIDFMVKAVAPSEDESIPFQMTFEDAEGNLTKLDQKMKLVVSDAMPEDPMMNGMMDPALDGLNPEDMEGKASFPVWAILLIVAAALTVAGIVLSRILKKRKAKKEQAEIDEMV